MYSKTAGYVLKDALEVANRPSTYLPNFIIRQGDRSNKRGYSSILCAGKAWVFEKTEEFRQKYRERSGIERKNAEMKRFHGLARARGYGLRSVSLQAKFTAIAVNLKRIAKIVSSSNDYIFSIFRIIIMKVELVVNFNAETGIRLVKTV
ncbi:MAG: transposase [Firmicutes bacterium]|nr:transposase [Bacillota bacterium]